MPLPQDKSHVARPASSKSSRSLFLLVTGISVILVGLFLMLAFGQVVGSEFSPVTFQRRSFAFFQLPWVGWQVTPVWCEDQTQNLERHLKTKGLLPGSQATDRWDVSWMTQTGAMREADPQILMRYLDTPSPGNQQHWLDWSQQHPDLAKVLWPAVQQAALRQAYVVIPELFQLAEAATDPQLFQQQVDEYLRGALADFAADFGDT